MFGTHYLIGLGFVMAQAYCIWHCIRNRKPIWWIFLILAGFGVFWYFLYEIRGGSGPRGRSMGRAKLVNLNPGKVQASDRLIRHLEEERERGDTVDLRIRLAEAHLELGHNRKAVELFKSCLKGHHKDDPVILFGLAQSLHENGDHQGALTHLKTLDDSGRTDYTNERALLEARVRAAIGDNDVAKERFELACRLPGEEARCEFALFLKRLGETDRANELFARILSDAEHGDRDFQHRNKEWIATAKAELKNR